MVYFHTKNADLGIFLWAMGWKIFGILITILVYFSHFGLLYQEESGNPVPSHCSQMVYFQTKKSNLDKLWRALD
jgi:hypothetical protein